MAQRVPKTGGQGRPMGVLTSKEPPELLSWDEFERFVLSHPDRNWELYDGVPREKPGMSAEHNEAMTYVALSLGSQLDRRNYRVRINSTHVERSTTSYYIPDVSVAPAEAVRRQLGRPDRLEMFRETLLLVIEVWSRSTGRYDAMTKIPEYRERGDLEIWRLHPYERTLTVWRRQDDGTYEESHYSGGKVSPAFLPNVTIDLDDLFDFAGESV
jgi:Uma2 family endonuclease